VIRQNLDKAASELISSVRQAVCEFSGGERSLDDFTMVVMKVSPE